MGIRTMSSHAIGGGKQAHVQNQTTRQQNSWFCLTLDEIKARLGHLGKPFGSLYVDELLSNVVSSEDQHLPIMGSNATSTSPSASLQRQASMSLARALKGKTVDEVWREINKDGGSNNTMNVDDLDSQGRESNLGGMTLEDFLVKAGTCLSDNANANNASSSAASLRQVMSLDRDTVTALSSQQIGLSSSPSIDALSESPTQGRKREPMDLEMSIERRMRRKIKNRESAARSRARKQAYHNELVTKVTRLEDENSKLGKEKEFDEIEGRELTEPIYQLRRASTV